RRTLARVRACGVRNRVNAPYRSRTLIASVVATACPACFAMVMTLSACAHRRPAVLPTTQGVPTAGIVEGPVIGNGQPVAGGRVYATNEYNFSSTHYGEATTDANGHFSIPRVPPGQRYLYTFGNGPGYWVAAVTPFVMPAGAGTVAADTYVCRGFDPIA